MSRKPFITSWAHIVVSTDGYFDVYPSPDRAGGDRPLYRGEIAELGTTVGGHDGRLLVRPNSQALANAVMAWAQANGEKALAGDLGAGRDGSEAAA